MVKSLPLYTSYKFHSIIATIISIWLVVFLVLIAPFDASDLSFMIRLQILPFYGVISFIGYMLLVPFQNWVFKRMNRWTIIFEVLFIFVFNILVLLGSFWYYKTEIINGIYSFSKFSIEVYTPICFILLSILIFSRWFLNRKAPTKPTSKITLTGDNKLDILKIKQSDLICISNSQNYVEIFYLENAQLRSKLIRSSLKKIQTDFEFLIQIHRSHLINPEHFKSWKDSTTILLTQIELPVSKNYKERVLAL